MPPKKIEKDKNQHIQVVVRCRPLSGLEKKQGSYNIVDAVPDRREVHIKERATLSAPSKTFTFDRVFGPQAKQIELYRTTVVPIIAEVLLGYNCTIFAYGQTGTGKTFTMEGEKSEDPSVCWENDPLSGIIPRAMSQLFARLDKMNCEYTIRVSFLEIYNEELIDLLGADSVENPRLKIYEDVAKKGSHVIQGLEDVVVLNKDAVYSILERGTQRRQTAATMMNAHSSRSHSVFMVTIHMRENSVEGEELLKTGKLNLVDLAGSECIGKSGAIDKRAREAGNINQSLLTLGRVITALVEHAPHIPYRESKLTRLLQDSLGGRTKTSIIATISPASSNIEETLSTLDYAHRAKNITNRPEINQKLTKKALLKEYTEEMERLRRDLQAARDKNGFYIAEENYNAMHTQIIQQKDHIKDIEGKMDVLGSEMYKLNEMFTETKEELEETTKQLEVTSKNLEETTDNLEKTRGNLRRTRQDRDEQKHIVMQQVKTETKLHGQASQLMYTADTATTDVSGLHAKLDRKRAVETHNENVQESFRVHFRESIDNMETGLKSFTETQLQTISDMDDNIGCMLDKRIGEVKGMTQDISGVVTMVTDQLTAIHKSQTENTKKTQAWGQELVANCKESRDKEVCRQFEFYEQTFQAAITSVSSALTQLSADLDKLQQSVHTQRQKQQENLQAFADKQVSSLDCQRALVSEYTEAQAASIERHRNKNQEIFTSQQQNNKATTDQFLEGVRSLMADMLEAQKSHLSQNIDQMDKDLLSAQTETTDFHEKANRHIDECTEVVQGYKTQLQERTMEQDAESKRDIDELQSKVEQITQSNKSLEKEVGSHSEISREVCLAGSDKIIQSVEQQLEESNTQLETHSVDTQSLSSSCSSALNDMDSKQTSQQREIETTLQAQKATLEAHRKVVLAWSETHHEDMETRDQEVENFLTDEISKDLPTGTTPQRRDFSYPHNLVRTNRHSEIVQEFRKTYLLEEAMNVPIPDDSFPSMSSVPQMILDEAEDPESVDDTRTTEDPDSEVHNLSEDSAFGTNSSTVSDSDKMQRCESKENLMRPPNTIPTKSRTGSSRTTSSKSKAGAKTPTQGTPTKSKGNTTPSQGSSKLPSRLPLRPANK